MAKVLTLLALFCAPLFSFAQSSSLKLDRESSLSFNSQNFKPYLGASFGYMDENRGLRTEGTPWNLKLIGSFYTQGSWIYDGGVGVLGQHFSNAEDKTALAATLEASSRYRFKGNWQLGPHLKTYTGVGDLYGSSTNLLTSFAGVQGLKEFTAFERYQSRVGLSVVTDIGIPNQVAYVTTLELQITLASLFGKKRESLAAAPVKVTPIEPAAEIVIQKPMPQRDIKTVYFELGETNLNEKARSEIQMSLDQLKTQGELGPDSVVRVIGHADQMGDRGLNLKVSRNRARAVRNELINSGLRPDQIQVQWVGKAEASLEPRLKDRKVELKRVQ